MKNYNGLPLAAFSQDNIGWGGRSNFSDSTGKPQLKSVQDCVDFIRGWGDDTWYIFDGTTNTCYVSSKDVVEHVKEVIKHNYGEGHITFKVSTLNEIL